MKIPLKNLPQTTTGVGILGSLNQIYITFKGMQWSEVIPAIKIMTVEESVMAFGPIIGFLYLCWFDENKHHEIKKEVKG
jgi:hypothetical protein